MNKNNSEIKIGLVAISAILILIWGVSFLKGKNVFTKPTHFFSIYEEIDGMEASAPVRINGYKVGKVTDVFFHPDNSGKIIVKYVMHEKFAIPKNTIANIYNSDLMGTKAIQLNIGNSAIYASSGDTLFSSIEGDLKDEVNKQVLPLKIKLKI